MYNIFILICFKEQNQFYLLTSLLDLAGKISHHLRYWKHETNTPAINN